MEKKSEKMVYETADRASYDLLKQLARENRLFMTEAEQTLWTMLRGNNVGCKFRRQHIIGDYIADFVNLHHKLVVEVAGKYHFKGEQPVSDEIRTAELNRMGYTVVRFTNEEVLGNINKVARQLKDLIRHMEISYPQKSATTSKPSHPTSSPPSTHPTSSNISSPTPSQPSPNAIASPSPFGEGWDGDAWAVDAACSGNPGPMEYQCVDLTTGEQVFHFGPVWGTNNIGEFLAIVHALALMEQRGITDRVIYSDSYNAILWVKKKQCKTKLERNAKTEQLYQVIARAENWLKTHRVTTQVLKWETKAWGEIPADFGRKG